MEPKEAEKLKELVRDNYTRIADQDTGVNKLSCCGATGCSTVDHAVMADDYSEIQGHVKDADLGLGCGLPTELAAIRPGDTVVDLGSGAGNDAFVARALTGEQGKVIGIDFTERMIEKAKENASKLNYVNVEFRQGDIENMPLAAGVADVVVSNCVLNLVPDKERAFQEMFRILKHGGHFCVSDIVLTGNLPEELRTSAEMYAGCVAGAISKEDYISLIEKAGFTNVAVKKAKKIVLPDDLVNKYLTGTELSRFTGGETGIFSITVFGEKPEKKSACCGPECCN